MSATVFYKDICLITCSASLLSDLSSKMVDLAVENGHSMEEYVIGFGSCFIYSMTYDLSVFSKDEITIFAKFTMQAIDKFLRVGYSNPAQEDIQYAIEKNIPINISKNDEVRALEYKENLKHLLKELATSSDV